MVLKIIAKKIEEWLFGLPENPSGNAFYEKRSMYRPARSGHPLPRGEGVAGDMIPPRTSGHSIVWSLCHCSIGFKRTALHESYQLECSGNTLC